MLSKKNLDELNVQSRAFYERSLMKMNLSLVFAAFAFFFLGLCTQAGTKAAHENLAISFVDDDANYKKEVGYGFAAFFHILGFVLSSAVSIYFSPLFCGTKNESKILSTPQNIDGGDASAPPLTHATPIDAGYPQPPQAVHNKV